MVYIGKPPAGKGVESVDSLLKANIARTFEFLLHFVRRDTVTVSPNQIYNIIFISAAGDFHVSDRPVERIKRPGISIFQEIFLSP